MLVRIDDLTADQILHLRKQLFSDYLSSKEALPTGDYFDKVFAYDMIDKYRLMIDYNDDWEALYFETPYAVKTKYFRSGNTLYEAVMKVVIEIRASEAGLLQYMYAYRATRNAAIDIEV